MRRRASLAAGLMAGTAFTGVSWGAWPAALPGALLGALVLAGAGAAAAQDAPVGQTLTARISERLTADSNYRLDDPSPGTSTYADTRLLLGYEKNTDTQTFGLGLDTGLRALWEADQDFEFTVASPTGANANFSNEWANGLFDAALNYRQRQIDSSDDFADNDNLDQLPGNAREYRYDANVGVLWGTSTPSTYELRFLGTHFDYSNDNTNKVPRTTLEGQGTWTLQLTPVLASQAFVDYLHYQADNDANTELANVDVTAGLVYQPDETLQVSGGLGYSERKRWDDDILGERELTQDNNGPVVRAGFAYQVPDSLTFLGDLRYTTAAPDPQLSGSLRAIYPLPRGQLTGRIFQDYTGTDSGGQEAQVSGVSVGLLHDINEVSSLSFNIAYAVQVDVDDVAGEPTDPDIHRTNFTAIYSYDLTDTISADLGYRYRYRQEDPQTANSHAVFVEIGKAFTTQP
jgi:hypothetical protein